MLEGVDRLIDLAGPRTSALSGASESDVVAAVGRCDAASLSATDGHFAVTARDGKTVRLARTIGIPLRYFVAKMYHGPFLVVAERMEQIFAWCREQRIAWQFDPAYTRMVPAHHIVELDQVGCPDPSPRYHRFFDPAVGLGSSDPAEAGARYITAAYESVLGWLKHVPIDEPVAVAFSGGVDSTSVLLMTVRANEALGGRPDRIRAFTLDMGGGRDAAQAERAVHELGLERQWERVSASPADYDLEAAIRLIEDYHPLDVECAATSMCLLRGIRDRYPRLTYLLDGDGGDENLKSYPLEDSDLTLSSILRNPLLYQEGWGVDAIKHSLAYSGGLSRGYLRTYAPAAALGFAAFSPYTTRSVIASSVAIPFEQILAGDVSRLSTLKQDVVSAGVKATLDIEMPVNQKRRFQDGASASPRERASKAWCRRIFNRLWQDRQKEAESLEQRSGNEVVPVGEPR
jgi:asparagine synthase (glutamine-hydrolysing)